MMGDRHANFRSTTPIDLVTPYLGFLLDSFGFLLSRPEASGRFGFTDSRQDAIPRFPGTLYPRF